MFDILEKVDEWLARGHQIALATVVETWGSAPRRAGAKMAVAKDLSMIGSVSGGCVETAVIEEALHVLNENTPRLLSFGVSDDEAWDVGLACGGKITIYVEPLDAQWWRIASDAARHDEPITTVTIIQGDDLTGHKLVLDGQGRIAYGADALLDTHHTDLIHKATAQRDSGRVQVGELEALVDVQRPRPQLIIIGGAHVAMALKNLAYQLGFRVALIDPRKAFASEERFPDVPLILHSYPDRALEQVGLAENSYVTILTHDPKIDDPALRTALPSKAPYVGILSSRRTHEKRIKRLTDAGVDPALLKRIRIPIGLDIGAQTPEEIALSIMAEIVAVRNRTLT